MSEHSYCAHTHAHTHTHTHIATVPTHTHSYCAHTHTLNTVAIYAILLTRPPHTHAHTHTQVLQEIRDCGINIYEFPDTDGDAEEAAANKKLRVS